MLRFMRVCRNPLATVGALGLVLFMGCPSSTPPPVDKATVEKELKQLNDNRQKEWTNK